MCKNMSFHDPRALFLAKYFLDIYERSFTQVIRFVKDLKVNFPIYDYWKIDKHLESAAS